MKFSGCRLLIRTIYCFENYRLYSTCNELRVCLFEPLILDLILTISVKFYPNFSFNSIIFSYFKVSENIGTDNKLFYSVDQGLLTFRLSRNYPLSSS